MKGMRSLAVSTLIGGVLFATASRAAQHYLLTGKFANSQGALIDIPVIGDNPGGVRNCGSTTMGVGMLMVPGMTPIFQGYRSTIMTTGVPTPPIAKTKFANNRGCLSLMGKLDATAPGAGKAFTFPTHAINHMFPGMTVAVSIPFLPNVIQFATSFQFTGPPKNIGTGSQRPGSNLPNGTMNNGMNTAKFRFFHKSAWLTQTGRAGSKFTWCFGNPNCTKVTQAKGYPNPNVDPVHQLIVKYTPGVNKFGGTMTHVINSGVNKSSLAISVGGGAQFLGLAGSMGQMRTGRGYADYGTDPLMGGMAFATFMVGPVYIPQLMSSQKLITKLGPQVPASGSSKTISVNKNFGFPFTTGTVLARNTGRDIQNNAFVVTLTGMGKDVVTGMGARNISLVAGALAGIDLLSSETPGLNQMFLPEPGTRAQLFAGVVALLGVAVRRARVARERRSLR